MQNNNLRQLKQLRPFDIHKPPAKSTNTTPHKPRIIVQMKMVGNWKQSCKDVVSTASKYNGQDSLELILLDQGFNIEPPNLRVDYCERLVQDLEKITGVHKVFKQ